MKHIFVTGAGGYIGSVLIPKLLDKGYKVTALDRFFFGENKLTAHPSLTIMKQDCRQIKLSDLEGMDAVIDLVAISNDPSGELFQMVTNEINHLARARTARLAKQAGVKRYILPSSCSIYGFQNEDTPITETAKTNPLTTYARANERAELAVLPLADKDFTVTVLRQATVYGHSPRMRFDLAVNGMTYGAWENGVIPLMRNGKQWRPMIHVSDTTDVMCLLLEAEAQVINGEIFNVGTAYGNYQLLELATEIADVLPISVEIKWYGDPDHRSYRVSFDKIKQRLGWSGCFTAADGALDIFQRLSDGTLKKTPETITLDWYQQLVKWHGIIQQTSQNGGMLELQPNEGLTIYRMGTKQPS